MINVNESQNFRDTMSLHAAFLTCLPDAVVQRLSRMIAADRTNSMVGLFQDLNLLAGGIEGEYIPNAKHIAYRPHDEVRLPERQKIKATKADNHLSA